MTTHFSRTINMRMRVFNTSNKKEMIPQINKTKKIMILDL